MIPSTYPLLGVPRGLDIHCTDYSVGTISTARLIDVGVEHVVIPVYHESIHSLRRSGRGWLIGKQHYCERPKNCEEHGRGETDVHGGCCVDGGGVGFIKSKRCFPKSLWEEQKAIMFGVWNARLHLPPKSKMNHATWCDSFFCRKGSTTKSRYNTYNLINCTLFMFYSLFTHHVLGKHLSSCACHPYTHFFRIHPSANTYSILYWSRSRNYPSLLQIQHNHRLRIFHFGWKLSWVVVLENLKVIWSEPTMLARESVQEKAVVREHL